MAAFGIPARTKYLKQAPERSSVCTGPLSADWLTSARAIAFWEAALGGPSVRAPVVISD